MAASKQDIDEWFDRGVSQKSDFMIDASTNWFKNLYLGL